MGGSVPVVIHLDRETHRSRNPKVREQRLQVVGEENMSLGLTCEASVRESAGASWDWKG